MAALLGGMVQAVSGASLGLPMSLSGLVTSQLCWGKVLFWKESHPPSSFSPSTTQPQQCMSACLQNIPMNYLCALEPKLTGNIGTVQKGCRQWGSAANYVSLSVSNAVTSARGEGSSPVFLVKRRMEVNKQSLGTHVEQ